MFKCVESLAIYGKYQEPYIKHQDFRLIMFIFFLLNSFDCNDGRMQIIAEATKIFDPLVKAFEDQDKISKEDPGQRLPVIFPGCLLNFCNETPQAVEVLARNRCTEAVIRNILQTKTNGKF